MTTATVPSVAECIANTIRLLGEYFAMTLASRQPGGTGSTFDVTITKHMLETFDWQLASHHEVSQDCVAFQARNVPGHCGMIHLPSQYQDLKGRAFRFEDPKETGLASAVLVGDGREFRTPSNSCWIILGQEQGEWVVFTFHPGAPCRPTPLRVEDVDMGIRYTAEDLLALGVEWVKINDLGGWDEITA